MSHAAEALVGRLDDGRDVGNGDDLGCWFLPSVPCSAMWPWFALLSLRMLVASGRGWKDPSIPSRDADAGELDEALDLFEEMQESGVRPDVISWNTLVSGFARNGDLGAALHLFDEMRLRGVEPGVNSWNCIIV
ncbi:hypothetical protein SEVIR_6G091400v4 [Setaria viridis]